MEEDWKDIIECKGEYQASTLGRIRSIPRVRTTIRGRTYSVKGGPIKLYHRQNGYTQVSLNIKGNIKTVRVHVIVWVAFNGPIPKGLEIDHIDRNPRNNELANLRLGTKSQNEMNKGPFRAKSKTSKYKGVGYYKDYDKWTAIIHYDKVRVHLGYFKTELEAVRAYNKAAKEHHGEFAYINVIEGENEVS